MKGSVRDFGPRVQKKEIGRIILDGSRDLFSVHELYGDLCKGNVPARVRGGIVGRTANITKEDSCVLRIQHLCGKADTAGAIGIL